MLKENLEGVEMYTRKVQRYAKKIPCRKGQYMIHSFVN